MATLREGCDDQGGRLPWRAVRFSEPAPKKYQEGCLESRDGDILHLWPCMCDGMGWSVATACSASVRRPTRPSPSGGSGGILNVYVTQDPDIYSLPRGDFCHRERVSG